MEIYDEDTGLIRSRRVDPAARIYYENGEKTKRKVRGTKWFFASGRDTGYWTRVIFSFAHVAGGEYEDEAAIAVRQFRMLKEALPHCMGVVYDGAFRGVHRDALARNGLLAINKQHGSVAPVFYERITPCRSGHELWCDQGRIAESIRVDDGTRVLEPVPIIRLEHRAGATKSRWCHLLKILADTEITTTASPWASPPPPPTGPSAPPTPASASRATPSAASTEPKTSSRSLRPASPTNSSTPTAPTPSPCTASSTSASGTAA
ncbi:hypothetical protein AB4039_32625 [Streptomyces sp. M-16]|uniref:hypothetical protein n=1 Tax=Streptomyces sp. M-16 TaxID=3233040 RepID=UPI003F9D2868